MKIARYAQGNETSSLNIATASGQKKLWVLQAPWMYQSAQQIKAANPNAIVLCYMNMIYDSDWSGAFPAGSTLLSRAQAQSNGSEYNPAIQHSSFQWLCNVGLSAYRTQAVSNIIQYILQYPSAASPAWDGVFIDDCNWSVQEGVPPGYSSNDNWRDAALVPLAQALMDACTARGKILIANMHGTWGQYRAQQAPILPHLHGGLDEFFGTWPGGAQVQLSFVREALAIQQDCGAQGKIHIANTTMASGSDSQRALFGYCLALCGTPNDANSYYAPQAPGTDVWLSQFATDIGAPTDTYVESPTGVFTRHYQRATIVANWNTLTGTFTTTSGPFAPSAPTGVAATAGDTQVALTWTAPSDNGGSAITGYRITPFIGATAQTAINTGTTGTSRTITGLVNGTTYTFKVAATNSVGTGAQSAASNAVTPVAAGGGGGGSTPLASELPKLARTSATLPLPSGAVTGDLLVVYYVLEVTTTAMAAVNTTPVGQANEATDGWTAAMFYKVNDGTPISVTWDGLSRVGFGVCVAYHNVGVVNATSGPTNDDAYDVSFGPFGGLTTTVDNCIIATFTANVNSVSVSPSAGYVQDYQSTENSIEVAHGTAPSPSGPVSAVTFTGIGSARSINAMIAIGPAAAAPASNWATQVLVPGTPAAWYRCNETSGTTWVDSSGNGRNGTLTASGVSYQQGSLVGDGNHALLFDGTVGEAQASLDAALYPLNDYTLVCWVKGWTGTDTAIVRNESATGGTLIFDPGTGFLQAKTRGDIITTTLAMSAVQDGQPHMFALRRSGTTGTLWVDGIQRGSVTTTAGVATGPWHFGRNGTNSLSDDFTAMTGDEFVIYGSAVSDANILALYHSLATPTKIKTGTFGLTPILNDTNATTYTERATVSPSAKLSGTKVFQSSGSYVKSGKFLAGTRVSGFKQVVSVGVLGDVVRLDIFERPPIRHTMVIDPPTGPPQRWGPDTSMVEDVFTDASWSSTMPGGWDRMDCALFRKPELSSSDIPPFSRVTVYNAGGKVVGQFRVEQTPATHGDSAQITPGAVGYQSELDDNKATAFVYVDAAASSWIEPTLKRQIFLAQNARDIQTLSWQVEKGALISHIPDSAVPPNSQAETWYTMPPGSQLGTFQYQGTNALPAGYQFGFYLFDLDDTGANQGIALTYDGTVRTAVVNAHTRLLLQIYAAGVSVTGSKNYASIYPRVFGYTGTAPRTGPDGWGGVFASDAVLHAVTKFTKFSTLGGTTITASRFVIPHLVFRDLGAVSDIVRGATRFGLEDWAVWEAVGARRGQPVFYFGPRRSRGRTWRARVGPSKLNYAGTQVARVWNSVVVQYTDAFSGETRSVGPTGATTDDTSGALLDSDPLNPANVAGKTRRALLQMQTTTLAGAIQVGTIFLSEQKLLDSSGDAEFTGWIQDDHGTWHVASDVRAGDYVEFVDSSHPGARRIVKAQWSEATRSCKVDLDSPPEALDALLERLQVVLVPLGDG